MHHDICYQDNPTGKHECDRKMLAELNALVPKGKHEKVDRQLVRSIIGLKHRLGLHVHLEDCFVGKQNKGEAYYTCGRHSTCDTINIAQNHFRLPSQTI